MSAVIERAPLAGLIRSRSQLLRYDRVTVVTNDLDALSARFEQCLPAPRGRHHQQITDAERAQRDLERVSDPWL